MRPFLFLLVFIAFCNSAFAQSADVKTEIIKQITAASISEQGYYYHEFAIRSDKAKAEIISTDWIAAGNGPHSVPSSSLSEIRIAYTRKVPKLIVKIPAVKQDAITKEILSGFTIKITDPEPTITAARPIYPANSVLATGEWYKIGITKRGVYKIDAAFLNNIGINTSSINPANIRIYGNGGKVMTEVPDDSEPNDLIENAIYVSSTGSSFGGSDYVLFYADGPLKWTYGTGGFEHTLNYFSDTAYYFINVDKGPGKRIASVNETAASPISTYTTFDDYAVIDNDSFYHSQAGKIWWSNQMLSHASGTLKQTVNLQLTDPVGPIRITYQLGSTAEKGGTMQVFLNNSSIRNASFSPLGQYASLSVVSGIIPANISSKNFTLGTQYAPNGSGTGLLDYFAVTGQSNLNLNGLQTLNFRNVISLSHIDAVIAYQLQNAGSQFQVWDVSNILTPQNIQLIHTGSTTTVKVKSSGINELIAFTNSSFQIPTFHEKVKNQNLHALENRPLIIITIDSFIGIAKAIAAMHLELDGISSHIVTTQEIYNEFSSGSQDIAGIRNFIRMFYDRASNPESVPENILLLGAASYDYKDRVKNNTNFVPNYQSYGSAIFEGDNSYSTDDYYGLLDSTEALLDGAFAKYDVGIGRIPIRNVQEGQNLVNKFKNYLSSNSFGPWKNNALFLGDESDGAGNFNLTNDQIGNSIKNIVPNINHTKLYADAHQKEPGASSNTYPRVTSELNSQMHLGNLLVNYAGHGNPERLSKNSILVKSQINSYTNFDRLPLMITGTCDFGRYDRPGLNAGGAMMFLKGNGGSIASLTTTQQVFDDQSRNLISTYINTQFHKQEDGTIISMGKALMLAKNNAPVVGGSSTNNIKYALLGDPALKIALPKLDVFTDSILNYTSATTLEKNDTLSALGSYMLYGSVKNTDGSLSSDFNGTIYVSVYDKPQFNDVQPTSHFYSSYKKYETQNSVIYRGQAIATNGHFEIKMIIPKDLNYEFGKGKISYYAHDEVVDGAGFDTNIVVGGFADYQITDNDNPVVNVFIDDDKFKDGGVTGTDPMLFIKLSDDNGINVSGSSVGHDLIAILDGDYANPYILNNYYFTKPGDITQGTVYFPLSNLTEGMHEVEVRAWDMLNNPGTGKVHFEVRNKKEGFISETYCYPNPLFESYTNFVMQHNLKNDTVNITIHIFDNAGRVVKTLGETMQPNVNRLEIRWDARDESNLLLPSGLYHYRVVMRNTQEITATAYNKISIVR